MNRIEKLIERHNLGTLLQKVLLSTLHLGSLVGVHCLYVRASGLICFHQKFGRRHVEQQFDWRGGDLADAAREQVVALGGDVLVVAVVIVVVVVLLLQVAQHLVSK